MLTLEQQAAFFEEALEAFLPISWRLGKDGTHIFAWRGCTDGCTTNGLETAN